MRLNLDEEQCLRHGDECSWIQEDRARLEEARHQNYPPEEPHPPTEAELEKFAELTGAPYEDIVALADDVMGHIMETGYPGDEQMMHLVITLAPNHGITSTQVEMAFAHMEEGKNHGNK